MSAIDRKTLLTVVDNIQAFLCSYHLPGRAGPSGFCDCKYGAEGIFKGPHYGGEQTGCPEMREVAAILRHMTDSEYERIQTRIFKRGVRAYQEYQKKMQEAQVNEKG